ncbi:MAG: MATE family efflux transporter, partial [Clostridia bacterium]|nr:MATE family efflux transporter [Clostridia bacterium]
VFNYFLIYGKCGFPRLEVAGAAIATGIGTVVGFVIAVISVLQKDNFVRLSFRTSWKPDIETMKLFFSIGGAAMVEQVFLRIGFFIYVKLVASLGTTDYATHQICMQMLSLSFNFGDGIAIASTSLVGQSLGAKKPTLAMVYGRSCQRLALLAAVIIVISFTAFGRPILWIFTDDPAIIERGLKLFLIAAARAPSHDSTGHYAGPATRNS